MRKRERTSTKARADSAGRHPLGPTGPDSEEGERVPSPRRSAMDSAQRVPSIKYGSPFLNTNTEHCGGEPLPVVPKATGAGAGAGHGTMR